MGVSRSPQELSRKLQSAGANLHAAERPVVMAGAKAAETTFLAIAGARKALGRRGVNVKIRQTTSNGHAAAGVRFGPNPGWVSLLDSGSKPHFIGPRGRGSLKRQSSIKGSRRATRMAVASLLGGSVGAGTKGVINISGGIGPKAWAHHPGTKGKHFVAPAQIAAVPVVIRTVNRKTVTEYAKAFR